MDRYIPESCPINKPFPDDSDFTEEACSGCEYQCIKYSMLRLRRAAAEAGQEILKALTVMVDDLKKRWWPLLQHIQFPFPSPEIIKRRINHVRTWKRRDPRNGKSKKDR